MRSDFEGVNTSFNSQCYSLAQITFCFTDVIMQQYGDLEGVY